MSEPILTTLTDMLVNVRAAITSMQAELDNPTPESSLFVIGRDNIFIANVGIDASGKTDGTFQITNNVTKAHRFNQNVAKAVAATVHNGNGYFAAQSVTGACKSQVEYLINTANFVEQQLIAMGHPVPGNFAVQSLASIGGVIHG